MGYGGMMSFGHAAYHAAIAHDEVEAGGGEREDDDAGEQRQDEDVARELRIERQQHEAGDHQCRGGVRGIERGLHRLLAGNSPSGRSTSTIAISR